METIRLHDRRILVVEDDAEHRVRIVQSLVTLRCEYRIAANGEQALQVAAEFSPTLVLMSVSIPNQDGWLVCYKLKLRHDPPRVVLTMSTLEEAAKRFAQFVGADAILQKPVPTDGLDQAFMLAPFPSCGLAEDEAIARERAAHGERVSSQIRNEVRRRCPQPIWPEDQPACRYGG